MQSELYDNNEGGELYKGLLSFMLEESIICIAKSILETKIQADWLKDEILAFIKI